MSFFINMPAIGHETTTTRPLPSTWLRFPILILFLTLLVFCSSSSPPLSLLTVAYPTSSSRLPFIGTYIPSSSCTPSATCCCPLPSSTIVVSPDSTSPLALQLSGQSDGGAGCFYMNQLTGLFQLNKQNEREASYSIEAIKLQVNISLDETQTYLTLTSSKTGCAVVLKKTEDGGGNSGNGIGSSGGNNSNSSAGLSYSQSILLLSPTVASSPNSHSYLISFSVPITSPPTYVLLHYSTTSDSTLISTAMSLQSTSSLQNVVNGGEGEREGGSEGRGGGSYLVYVYSPIEVVDRDVLSYGFSYLYAGNTYNTETYTHSYVKDTNTPISSTDIGSSGSSSNSGGSSGVVDSVEDMTRYSSIASLFVGSYQVTSLCTPSPDCCCGVDVITISRITNTTTSLLPTLPNNNGGSVNAITDLIVSGSTDGGSGCLYQRELGGIFHMSMNQPLVLTNGFSANGVTVQLKIQLTEQESGSSNSNGNDRAIVSSSDSIDTHGLATATPFQLAVIQYRFPVLTVSNTFRSCPTQAIRMTSAQIQAWKQQQPQTAIPTPTTTSSTSSSSSTPLLRDHFLGSYEFDSTCIPSRTCCCAVGPLYVTPVDNTTIIPPLPIPTSSSSSTSSNNNKDLTSQVLLRGSLDGSSACLSQTSLAQPFTVMNTNQAIFKIDNLLTLTAQLGSSSGKEEDRITFVNSLYPTCISSAKRLTRGSSTNGGSHIVPTSAAPIAIPPSLLGSYRSDGSCIPSVRCCCTSGITTLSLNSSTSSPSLTIHTNFEGDMLACFNLDGEQIMYFNVINTTQAISHTFNYVEFIADWYEKEEMVLISNSIHPTCPTNLVKVKEVRSSGSGGKERGAVKWTTGIAVGVALCVVLVTNSLKGKT